MNDEDNNRIFMGRYKLLTFNKKEKFCLNLYKLDTFHDKD